MKTPAVRVDDLDGLAELRMVRPGHEGRDGLDERLTLPVVLRLDADLPAPAVLGLENVNVVERILDVREPYHAHGTVSAALSRSGP